MTSIEWLPSVRVARNRYPPSKYLPLNPRFVLAENRSAVYNTRRSSSVLQSAFIVNDFQRTPYIPYSPAPYISHPSEEEKYRERGSKTNYLYEIRNAISGLGTVPLTRHARHNSARRRRIFLIGSRARHPISRGIKNTRRVTS